VPLSKNLNINFCPSNGVPVGALIVNPVASAVKLYWSKEATLGVTDEAEAVVLTLILILEVDMVVPSIVPPLTSTVVTEPKFAHVPVTVGLLVNVHAAALISTVSPEASPKTVLPLTVKSVDLYSIRSNSPDRCIFNRST
jgi:hypothetical protein